MFAASHPFAPFEEARIPYRVVGPDCAGRSIPPGCGAVWIDGQELGRSWYWPRAEAFAWEVPAPGAFRLGEIHLVGHMVSERSARALLREDRGGWTPDGSIVTSAGGRPAGSILRAADGSLFLPFDPAECVTNLRSERYREIGRQALRSRVRSGAVQAYYAIRPLLPRNVQLALRRAVAHRQRPPELTASFAGSPVPSIDVWPNGHRWAMVLSHDVEARAGYEDLELLRGPEREAGLRSSWNFVPLRVPMQDRYEVGEEVLRALADEGCEVGVHGLHHDGRDLESLEMLRERLPAIRAYAERWGAVGFRAPATQRAWAWMPLLGFDYDSSFPDSDPYEPIAGGCCSWLPFFNGAMVELPITLPQDHTLFSILGHRDGSAWTDKVRLIRDRGGMALVLSHPDYARDRVLVEAYRALLALAAADEDAWHALPREVSAWWRRRADSRLEATETGWTIRGPASGEARIRWLGGDPGPAAHSDAAADGRREAVAP
jgi:peptidoglycan/xylan/chitin deacetylase (PgdA/CDA1 family)